MLHSEQKITACHALKVALKLQNQCPVLDATLLRGVRKDCDILTPSLLLLTAYYACSIPEVCTSFLQLLILPENIVFLDYKNHM